MFISILQGLQAGHVHQQYFELCFVLSLDILQQLSLVFPDAVAFSIADSALVAICLATFLLVRPSSSVYYTPECSLQTGLCHIIAFAAVCSFLSSSSPDIVADVTVSGSLAQSSSSSRHLYALHNEFVAMTSKYQRVGASARSYHGLLL